MPADPQAIAAELIALGYASRSVAVGAALLGAGDAIGHMLLPDHAPSLEAWRQDAHRCLDTALARTRSPCVVAAVTAALSWLGTQRGQS